MSPGRIEPVRAADLDDILRLEARAFADPWTRAHFEGELANRHSRVDSLRGADGALLGYVVFWTIVDEVQILDIAVDPDRLRQGLGRTLAQHVIDHARRQHCRLITLEVRRSNTAAIGLYESLGFCCVAVRARYYASDQEDAIVMNLELL